MDTMVQLEYWNLRVLQACGGAAITPRWLSSLQQKPWPWSLDANVTRKVRDDGRFWNDGLTKIPGFTSPQVS